MNKFYTSVDIVQIDPDKRIFNLSKTEKVKLTDELINRSYNTGKGIIITYDLSHSGKKINNRIYSMNGQRKGIESLTQPFNKPILLHHDSQRDPIGRFIGGQWEDLRSSSYRLFNNDLSSMKELNDAFESDDTKKIYKAMKKFDLLNNPKWEGLGRMRVKANITDEDAIKKFLDGRYLTFSAGSRTDRHVCSICDADWVTEGPCKHQHGRLYDEDMCVFICGDFEVSEGSVVNMPADKSSKIIEIQNFSDSETKQEDNEERQTIELTDCEIEDGLQEQTGCTDSTPEESTTNEKETNEESQEEEITDEETFKVPAGAKGNAQQVLDWKEKYGSEVKGMTAVGWARARQLATKSEIGLSTVKRMAAFNRHRKNAAVAPEYKSEPWKDRGHVAWLGWGGTSGIDWAVKISEGNKDEEEVETIDWELLDLALNGSLSDKALSTETRNKLPDDIFCGPDRSFPIPDCAHVTAGRRLIERSKLSDQQKKNVLGCIDRKAKILGCDKTKDEIEMEQKYQDAMKEIADLKEKIANILDYIAKQELALKKDEEAICQNNDEKNVVVEQNIVDETPVIDEPQNKVIDFLNKKVENPSAHSETEEMNLTHAKDELPAFEKRIVDSYKNIKEQYGIDSAQHYLLTQGKYLPRGFNPENYLSN